MKQIKKEIEYTLFGAKYTPTEESKKNKAWAYTLALTALSDVGAGSDKNLSAIRRIFAEIMSIAENETGYVIDKYNTKLVGCDYLGWKKNPHKVSELRGEVK